MEGGGEDLSIDELASNLSTYKDQLREVPDFPIFQFLYVFLVFFWGSNFGGEVEISNLLRWLLRLVLLGFVFVV